MPADPLGPPQSLGSLAEPQESVSHPSNRQPFTKGARFVVIESDLRGNWSGCRHGIRFACGLCGRRFIVGDTIRWVYANGKNGAPGGNFFVCGPCDRASPPADGVNDIVLADRRLLWNEYERLKNILMPECQKCDS